LIVSYVELKGDSQDNDDDDRVESIKEEHDDTRSEVSSSDDDENHSQVSNRTVSSASLKSESGEIY